MSTRIYKYTLRNISERVQISRFQFVETFRSGLDALYAVAYPEMLFVDGVQQIQLRRERMGIWGR